MVCRSAASDRPPIMSAHSSPVPAAAPVDAAPVKVIEPTRKRLRLRDLTTHVPLMRVMTVRDFKTKYKQSVLGQLWLFIQPFGMLFAFTVVFNGVADLDTGGIP